MACGGDACGADAYGLGKTEVLAACGGAIWYWESSQQLFNDERAISISRAFCCLEGTRGLFGVGRAVESYLVLKELLRAI